MDPSKDELLAASAGSIDTDRLSFVGLRGDRSKHLSRQALEDAIAALPDLPIDEGRVDLLVARGPQGQRTLHDQALLSIEGGMPGDRWANDDRYGPDYQLATTCSPYARVVANGQALELQGDNLYLSLDLSSDNLPTGSLLQLGAARVRVTPQAHNGCKKYVQRFGLHPMQLNMVLVQRGVHLRGIYLHVVEGGLVGVGDTVQVLRRGPA